MTFYDKVKELCHNNGTTITAFEREIGLSKGSAVKWKKSTPNTSTLIKIASFFNLSTDYFTDEDAEPPVIDAKAVVEQLIAQLGSDAQINFSADDMPDDEREIFATALDIALEKVNVLRKFKQDFVESMKNENQ